VPEEVAEVILTYARIEQGIVRALKRQEDLTDSFASTGDDLAHADVNYKRAFAEARSTARLTGIAEAKKLTTDAVDDLANQDTVKEYEDYLVAKTRHDACRQALLSVRTRIDALRSLMASHREVTG
jgi:hypothetical protein